MMDTVEMPVYVLERLIKSLEDAVNVCYDVDNTSDDMDRSYPFATGYSRQAMKEALEELKALK
jgi:hypothetical protein|tara:strand:+ start:484 stop:672 length:189 start_codon:yes stop_codon:yes gene_type:complete